MELCWLTTEKCNQNCYYCDRFLESAELSADDYNKILDKLIDYGVKHLTFGGGESLLLPCFAQLVKKASINGIHLKLVTNGKLIPYYSELIQYFDEITLSIDSIDSMINAKLGSGYDHYDNICSAIKVIREKVPNLKININTVATSLNIDQIFDMKDFVCQWNIYQWRIFRFCPLRGAALHNCALFKITKEQFLLLKEKILLMNLNCKLQFRDYIDMEKGYLLINPTGKLCISQDMHDVVVGDMIKDNLKNYFIDSAI